jgi:cell division protein FtsB
MTFSEFWTTIKIRKWGKYILTLLIFAVVFLFIGEQSVVHFIRRGREIRHLEEQRDMYREGAAKAEQEINTLQQPDSLERYAREHYYMHTPNEDIYLVEEPK